MDKDNIFSKYRLMLIKTYILIASSITILELIFYLSMSSNNLENRFFDFFFLIYMLIPTAINFLTIGFVVKIHYSEKTKADTKNFLTVLGFEIMTFNIACMHNYFSAVYCALCIPIFVCTIFSDKIFLKKCLAISIVSLAVSVTVGAKFEYHESYKIFMYNSAIALILIVVAYAIGVILINYGIEHNQEVEDQIFKQHLLKQQLKRDQMTGLFNNPAFYGYLSKAIENSENRNIPFCLSVIDIDNFKLVNDTYGHENGNIVLVTLARIMENHCSVHDRICRYGGEEFAIIFNNREINTAHKIMQNILDSFRREKFDFMEENVTFSGGICQYPGGLSTHEIFKLADEAMYNAKNNGKNCIMLTKKDVAALSE